MKTTTHSLVLALIISMVAATTVFALYTNGDFETGDFTGWTKSAFINNGFDQPPGSWGRDLSIVVGGPRVTPLSISDLNTGGNLKYPAAGNFSARINSELSYNDVGYPRNGNTISQTVTAVLDSSDSQVHIRFSYAAVMAKPVHNPHDPDHLPYFRVMAINTSNNRDIIFDFSTYVGEPGKNWLDGAPFGTRGDRWQYLDWTTVDLVSTEAHPVKAGDAITLRITAAGCSLGGHPGYAYVDEIIDSGSGLGIQAEGPAAAEAGSTITYTYTFMNDSSVPVDPTIVINPPVHVTLTTLGDTVHCSGTAPVTCIFSGLQPGGSGNFTVTGEIAMAAAGTTIVHDDYTIHATGFPPARGSPVLTEVSDQAHLLLTASGNETVKPGDQYIYTLNYTTDKTVSNASVRLTLPEHTSYLSSDKSCTEEGRVMTCDLGTLDTGSGSFNITVLVDRLKKVGIPLILPADSYSISASDAASASVTPAVTTDVLSPFEDVPLGHWAFDYIQSIWAAQITNCCAGSPLKYCPDKSVTRADAAVLIERAMGNIAPTPSPSGMFADVPYPGLESFTPFIEQFYNDGITTGCFLSPLKYCPNNFTTRGEVAVFILRATGNFSPVPTQTGMFIDVPYPGVEAFTPFIEQLHNEGITVGCSQEPSHMYCPQRILNRTEIAVFIQRAFHLPMPY